MKIRLSRQSDVTNSRHANPARAESTRTNTIVIVTVFYRDGQYDSYRKGHGHGKSEGVSVGCFTPYKQPGSFSWRKHVWTYSVLGDRIYEMRCLFVAVAFNALFIVLPHWDNMS